MLVVSALILLAFLLFPLNLVAEDEKGMTDIAVVHFAIVIDGEVQEIEKPEPESPPYEDKPQPTLLQICSCESGNGKYGVPQQFEVDGVTPLVGKLTPAHLGQDIGMCQINTLYHLEKATSLGYDIYEAEGNWGYATYLYETQGTQPWSASRSCWG